ncbi:MAG TPA: hypothetical protein VGK29_06905 [Paludibaculum sp.]|jgi:hypothetical protein
MAALWKYLLVALLLAGALLFLFYAVRSASAARVTAAPGITGLARFPFLWDAWNETMGYAILILACLAGAWLVGQAQWGWNAVWNGESWIRMAEAIDVAPEFVVREPSQSWKANVFYGLVMGLSFGLSALFADGPWTAARGFWVSVSFGFLLWMGQSAVENYTKTVRLSVQGLEECSYFGSRRIPWEEIGGLEFQDIRAQIEKFQDWKTRRSSTLPHIDIWAVSDRRGQELLRLSAEMEPEDVFRRMREQITKRRPAHLPHST